MADEDWVLTSSHFGVTIDDVTGDGYLGLFKKVSGLGVTVDALPVNEGGQNRYTHQLPGRLKWQDIELERGIVKTNRLMSWVQASQGDGRFNRGDLPMKLAVQHSPRCDGVITLYGSKTEGDGLDGQPLTALRQWTFKQGFPISWTGPSFAADSDDIATEKLVIAHAGLLAK